MENERETSLVSADEIGLDEAQLSEQLYNSAGLDPVVEAGLRDYDSKIQQENKLINKVLGPRGTDIRGYGESVAKRVALAVYSLLNKQYGGKMGNLHSYIMSLEDERNRANTRYDELMGRVIGILGDEYKELRTDSRQFMEKLTGTLGDDLKETRINQDTLMERLADIDGLRNRISALEQEKEQLKQEHEKETASLKADHGKAASELKTQIETLDSAITKLKSEKSRLNSDLKKERQSHQALSDAFTALAAEEPDEEKSSLEAEELHSFILKDSRVPGMVLEGVGKFIDLNKYLRMAIERGAAEVKGKIRDILNPGSEKQPEGEAENG